MDLVVKENHLVLFTRTFERVNDPVLSASGGLIGMSYGGSMPMNNMDVKYKEFSGMVGGRGMAWKIMYICLSLKVNKDSKWQH